MTEVMQGLVNEAKKSKYSSINPTLTDEDVVSVWDNVSGFIERQMSQQKGVNIQGLGTFTFSQKKLDVGNNKYILIQRPVFLLSEKFAQTHGLNYTKHHVAGQIPVVQLNFAALSFESPFDRDTVESCVKEVLGAVARSVSTKRNVEFVFQGIGRLQIRDSKVKMKFYKEFLNSMDGTGKLVDALKDRPGTVDSVMSNRTPTRANGSTTVVLPSPSPIQSPAATPRGSPLYRNSPSKPSTPPTVELAPPTPSNSPDLPDIKIERFTCIRISQSGSGLIGGDGEPRSGMPAIKEEPADGEIDLPNREEGPIGDAEQELEGLQPDLGEDLAPEPDFEATEDKPLSRQGSRVAVPIAQAAGVSFGDDLMGPPAIGSPKGMRGTPMKCSPTPMMMKRSLSPIQSPHKPPPLSERPEFERSKSLDVIPSQHLRFAPTPPRTPPGSACGHANAGQELCYLCHQRDRRNVPVSFAEERRKREMEEDRLLQQYQHLKDTEAILGEQESLLGKRHDNQKMAAFNLGVSEAIKEKKGTRDLDFHPSYVFQKRPLTPPRFIKQEKYSGELAEQVKVKDDSAKKRKADEDFLERLEQVQLAEDLAAQREQYLKEKFDQQDQYKRALSAQIRIRESLTTPPSSPKIRANKQLGPLSIPRTQIILPFSQTYTMKIQDGSGPNKKLVRFKPLPIPARLPDSSSPVFGKNDMNVEKMAEKRQRAHQLYQEQLATVEQRKREAILRQLQEQKEEDAMLKRTKQGLLEDRAERYDRLFRTRKSLESDWNKAKDAKKHRELEDRLLTRDPGALVHEQCDKYKRCGQCKRRLANCGESNIWSESRYIPGSRLMV